MKKGMVIGMKQDIVQRVIKFIIKYIWLICSLLIVIEFVSTLYITQNLIQQTAQSVNQSVGGEISGRVDGVLRMLTGLSKDERFSDTSVSLYERAVLARAYKESYNLFMIAFTDEDVNVVSTNEYDPLEEPFSLAHRDYMQRLYSTGSYQITDAFLAGADDVTMNYTIAVPIFKADKVAGSVFGSIYFEDIENIIERNLDDRDRNFYLLGENNTFMAGNEELYGKSLLETMGEDTIIGAAIEEIDADLKNGKPRSFWQLGKDGLCYITSMQVEPTNWTLIYQVRFASVAITLLPVLVIKVCTYILLCIAISLFGRRYLRRQFDTITHLVNRMAVMQKELFQSEQTDVDTLLDITEKGLTDQLTGLSTRTVMLNRVPQYIGKEDTGAVLFIDLDDLKEINDVFGHEAGDCALVHCAKVLKEFEQRYSGLSARYGGDEFLLLLKGITEDDVPAIADELRTKLNTVIHISEKEFTIHGSIGISLYPRHGNKIEELICKADVALYNAKRNGKNDWTCYEESK